MAKPVNDFGFREFGENVLGKQFYPKQKELLDAASERGCYVVGRFNNGGGKTKEVLVTLILGALSMAKAKVFSTSGSFRQIKDQLNPALHAYASRFPQYEFLENRIVTNDPNCFFHGFATNEAGRFEGQHGDENHPIMLLVDEAKTVKDPVFQSVDRCRPPRQHCWIVVVSSAGYAGGEFYRLNTTQAGTLTHRPVVQTSAECPHISKEEIAEDRAKWGPEHPLVLSMHDARFMPFVEGSVIQLEALDALLADPPLPNESGDKKGFCDFAWSESGSGDENVFAWRKGNVIRLEAFRAKGMMAVCGEFVRLFTKHGFKAHEIEGDASFEGANIIKQLRAMGWPIGSAFNGGPPRFSEHYANLASEMWCEGGQAIIRREFILPDDPDLYGQMLDRKIVPHNKGKLCIESKLAMKDPNREGGSVRQSPDRADAVFGAMAPLPLRTSKQVMGQPESVPHTGESFWGSRDELPERKPLLPGVTYD